MPDASRSERAPAPRRFAAAVAQTWRALGPEQRVAGIGALLLIVSTFGPFSFVEAAILLTGIAVLVLLRRRAAGHEFQLPFGDGPMIAAAGAWSAVLILVRLFSRPLGQGLLALVCATLLVLAGVRLAARRPRERVAAERRRGEPPRPRPPRKRTGAARKVFGADPPAWETPASGDPSAAEPPAWRPAPRERPGRSVPPASPIARSAERDDEPDDRR